MTEADGLVAAFSEYAAGTWGEEEWRQFGRATGTSDLLSDHPRLYRSLSFGDDDYPDAVWSLVPRILQEATGGSIQEKLQLVADFVPDLVSWVQEKGTHRTRKRFITTLDYAKGKLPREWVDDATSVANTNASNAKTMPNRPLFGTKGSEAPHVTTAQAKPLSRPIPKWEQGLTSDTLSSELSSRVPLPEAPLSKAASQIFIVHGHDLAAVNDVKVKVHSLTGIMPQVLADQPGQGDTIIEKFEKHAGKSDFAIVLLTPDDEGRAVGTDDLNPRARQNVILELGYFLGKLGRTKVAVLNKNVEHPSDINGVNYIPYGAATWVEELRRELRAAGFSLLN